MTFHTPLLSIQISNCYANYLIDIHKVLVDMQINELIFIILYSYAIDLIIIHATLIFYAIDLFIKQITSVLDSVAHNPLGLVRLDCLTLIRQPLWMGAILQYGRRAQFLKFLIF